MIFLWNWFQARYDGADDLKGANAGLHVAFQEYNVVEFLHKIGGVLHRFVGVVLQDGVP
jgi:hypothetical protein